MVLYPDIMRKAQEAIDNLTGSERLPTLDDRPKLPYIDALLKEVYRYAKDLYLEFRYLTEM